MPEVNKFFSPRTVSTSQPFQGHTGDREGEGGREGGGGPHKRENAEGREKRSGRVMATPSLRLATQLISDLLPWQIKAVRFSQFCSIFSNKKC